MRTRFTHAETAVLHQRIDAAMLVQKARAKWMKAFGHIREDLREFVAGTAPDGPPPVGLVSTK